MRQSKSFIKGASRSKSDQEIVAGAMQTLQQMYGSQIPNPNGYLVTRWQQAPFSYGFYSYRATGSTPNDRQALAESMNSRLFFAGEATSQNYPSTVHELSFQVLKLLKRL